MATLRGFLAGALFPAPPLSPHSALERLPEELKTRLDGVRLEPLEAAYRPRPHLRWRAGRGRLLHLYVQPTAELRAKIAGGGVEGRDSLWVLD